MSYITRAHVKQALLQMKQFHSDLQQLHHNYGLCMLDNTGRRNILMSSAQEEFFAQALAKTYSEVSNNGKTGEPDIMVGELERELECKITTPTPSGGINLQTDYTTLGKKGALDFLYVIADRDFEKFVVLHYDQLTTANFSTPSESSRGKAKLVKHSANDNCHVLWGSVKSKNKMELEKLHAKLTALGPTASKTRAKILKSIKYWNDTPTNYRYVFEGVDECIK